MSNKQEIEKKSLEISSVFKGTFNTPIGRKCLDHLKESFVDRDIYLQGLPIDQVAFRQGQANIVKQIIKEINK